MGFDSRSPTILCSHVLQDISLATVCLNGCSPSDSCSSGSGSNSCQLYHTDYSLNVE